MGEKGKGVLLGIWMGFSIGACIAFCQCACAIVSCDDSMGSSDLFLSVAVCTIIGAIVGLFVGHNKEVEANKEKERRAEEQRQIYQKEAQIRQNKKKQENIKAWLMYYENVYDEIMKNVVSLDYEIDYAAKYAEMDSKNTTENDYQIRKGYIEAKNKHIGMLHELIRDSLSETSDFADVRLIYVLKAIKCLKLISPEEAEYADDAYEKIKKLGASTREPLQTIHFISYGEVEPSFLNEDFMFEMEKSADATLDSFEKVNEGITDGTCYSVVTNYPDEFFKRVSELMWYYASKKPFEVDKFERTLKLYERYTVYRFNPDGTNEFEVCKVEELLARIYSKKNLGGEGTARQEVDFINKWIDGNLILKQELKYNIDQNQEIYALPSGLAWMELYDMELSVLRKLVEDGVNLTEELQTRLRFLESGGKADIKIYTGVPSDVFGYDSSAIEWGKNEFEVYFRKIANKRIVPEYSLALERWTKTLPLVKGQRISQNAMHTAFIDMVNDFDGEIICSKVRGEAVNLSNVINEEASLFQFTSERNRCVSMLFSCEKYGRNLNIEILTLFTPDKELGFEQLEKYCAAIKGNFYVNSFRETILQTVDEALKVKETMYGDVTSTMSNIYD